MGILTAAALIETLRTSRSDVFAEIPAHNHTFCAKIFKKDFMEELRKVPQQTKIGLQVFETNDGLVLVPSRKTLNEIRENGFSTAKSMKGEQFAEIIRTTKGSVWVKLPASTGKVELCAKVKKADFANSVEEKACEQATYMRIYGRDTGKMVVRAF